MWHNLAQLLHRYTKYQIYFGREPRFVKGPAIIIFPLEEQRLCCGLAGIVSIKRNPAISEIDVLPRITHLLEGIGEKGLSAVLDGSLTPDHYLNGDGCLAELEEHVRSLNTDAGFQHLFCHSGGIGAFSSFVQQMEALLIREEKIVEERAERFPTAIMEVLNRRLIMLRDISWAAARDILHNVEKITTLAGTSNLQDMTPSALTKYKKINFLLNCLDRLEVRGRDSAGLQIAWTRDRGNGAIPGMLKDELSRRSRWSDLVNGTIIKTTVPCGGIANESDYLSFTYKTASVVGELGQNTAALRKVIRNDQILHALSGIASSPETVFVHTRWASVGSITEENSHPVNSCTVRADGSYAREEEALSEYPHYGKGLWTISVALNGDIDNYLILRGDLEKEGIYISPSLTTDTKIIPLVVQKYLSRGEDLATAFRHAVDSFEGSHAIAMVSNVEPDKVYLAQKGSGQSIYVGLAADQYIFASELYGLVEVTPYFLKMDGEKPAEAEEPESSGQIYILDQNSRGGIEGIRAYSYNGKPITLNDRDIQKAEITTRDIDRGRHPHYFLKEIAESTLSVKKTLRGKYLVSQDERGKVVQFNLGEDVVPMALREALLEGRIGRIILIGHGTAAVAGEAIVCSLERYLAGAPIRCEYRIASELSGFCLDEDFHKLLIIAITQSGTTTDTNRAVAMAVERGATVLAIVNRRQSDITTKAQGVFYTSDGRDIEMSVASTKAFYSQIIAGHILSLYLAQLLRTRTDEFIAAELALLRQAPELMAQVLNNKESIRKAAEKTARHKKYWAIVGSGPNKAAADEIRIKLSELCYRTISSDIIENKKHIDLSAEPLIIVCAAGNPEAVQSDIIKDVAIFQAHQAGVVVFADEGEDRFQDIADAVIALPRAAQPLPVILNTLAGHLWGYYAACSIDENALFLRKFRSKLNEAMQEQTRKNYTFYEKIADRQFRHEIRDFYQVFHQRRQDGSFSFCHVNTFSDLILLLKYAAGKLPLDDFWHEFPGGKGITTPAELLDIALGRAIDELSRPIDAIRHQAKTVTVGTSRKEPKLAGVIFDLLKSLEFAPHSVSTKNILSLTDLQPTIGAIRGYTLYAIDGLDEEGNPTDFTTIAILNRGGAALGMKSRVEKGSALMGTKRTIVGTGNLYVGYGKADGASVAIIPLLKERQVRHLLLIHVAFNESLTMQELKRALGYRYNDIRNLINEYNLVWDDAYLEKIPLAILLGEPPELIAERIRREAQSTVS